MFFRFYIEWRRKKLREQPFPQRWLEVLEKRVPYYKLLLEADQRELRGHIQVFVAEKHFEACGGLKLTEEMKVVIAAQACVLLLHRKTDYFSELQSIVIYPRSYVGRTQTLLPGGVVAEGPEARLGESWGFGTVILAWDDVLAGARDIHDGHNVVMHEFAHQLDEEDGSPDGTPRLELRSQYTAWARVLSEEFHQLNKDADSNRRSVMDKYGATNPAEFFAVLTETFFEKPVQLRRKHPELYEELKSYYRQDPAGFHA